VQKAEREGYTGGERDGDREWRATVGGLSGLEGDPFGGGEGVGPGTRCC